MASMFPEWVSTEWAHIMDNVENQVIAKIIPAQIRAWTLSVMHRRDCQGLRRFEALPDAVEGIIVDFLGRPFPSHGSYSVSNLRMATILRWSLQDAFVRDECFVSGFLSYEPDHDAGNGVHSYLSVRMSACSFVIL
jgi:hypothetical protein